MIKIFLFISICSFLYGTEIFIQQEHEGNLSYVEWRDGGYGNVFGYYEPVAYEKDLLDKVSLSGNILERANYNFGKLFGLKPAFNSLSVWLKEKYLELLLKRYESLGKKTWEDRKSLLLVRKKKAPSYIDDHPSFERDIIGYGPFHFPEITTKKESYSLDTKEAIERAKRIVLDTSHAGIHFHVFLQIEEEKLRKELKSLLTVIELENDRRFLEATLKNPNNLSLPAIEPWHVGRTNHVIKLIESGGTTPSNWDDSSEKRVFLAFRFWDRKEGKLLISLEVRGLTPDFVIRNKLVRGLEDTEAPTRDYSTVEYELTRAWQIANALLRGELPKSLTPPSRVLDINQIENLIESRRKKLGIHSDQVLSLEEFSRLLGFESIPLGFLFPFSSKNNQNFIDKYLELGKYRRNPTLLYIAFFDAYTAWAQLELKRTLDHLKANLKIKNVCQTVFDLLR